MESPFSSVITQECQSLPCLNFLSTTSGANNHTYLCSPGVMSCGLRCPPVVRKWLIPRSSLWLGLAMAPSSGHSDYATWPQCGLQCASSQISAPGLYRVGYVCWSQEELAHPGAALARPAFCERQKVLLTLPLLPPTALEGTALRPGPRGVHVTVFNVGAEAFQRCTLHVLFRILWPFSQECGSAGVGQRLSGRAWCWQGTPHWLCRDRPECGPLMPVHM